MAQLTDSSSSKAMQFLDNSGFNTDTNDLLEGDISGTTRPKPTAQQTPGSAILNLGSGSSSAPQSDSAQHESTLDEPIRATIMRDVRAVAFKLGHVFFPQKSNLLLKEWDLWAPLFLCVLLSITLQGNSQKSENAIEFASVFALITVGAIVVTINTKLLSGKISFFQSICVLGYCLLPLVLVALFDQFLMLLMGVYSKFGFTIRFVLSICACGWSVYASTGFLAADTINLTERKALAIFPIFLFYFVIMWLVILDTN